MQSISENDFECLAKTGMNTPDTMSSSTARDCPKLTLRRIHLSGREPVMRISTSLLAIAAVGERLLL
jgi:hypothetical protein